MYVTGTDKCGQVQKYDCLGDCSTYVLKFGMAVFVIAGFCHGVRSSLFWDVAQRRLVVGYRRFGIAYRFHLQGLLIFTTIPLEYSVSVVTHPTPHGPVSWIIQFTFPTKTLKMGPIGCPVTSVISYQSVLRNIPEEWRYGCVSMIKHWLPMVVFLFL